MAEKLIAWCGLGGFLIALIETWHLVETAEWPAFVFWILTFAMAALGLLYTAVRQKRSTGFLD